MCDVMFFFFKQKTAYEMRISDWSSDVCSSDLLQKDLRTGRSERSHQLVELAGHGADPDHRVDQHREEDDQATDQDLGDPARAEPDHQQIGRASGGERVCQYV